jgi:UDP:flavonoid glycosyltransferase YjiC (YdhE family)
MQQILDALAGLPVRVTATIDHSVTAKRLRIPANVDAYGYVDHAVVMPEVALVISHGGHATTMYSLAHDLPVLVVSQHSKLDQPLIGQVLERHHAGITLDQYPELSDMQAATTELLESDSAANAAAQIGARLREQNGSSNASDRIEASVGIGAAT